MYPTGLVALAGAQRHVLSRAQLRALGVSRHKIRSELRALRWQAIGPRVVVLHTGPLTREQRWWFGVLHAGPRAALCGLSAAEAGGLTGWESDRQHVIVPHGQVVPALPMSHAPAEVVELVLHRSRQFTATDVHPGRHLPQTRIERSVVDAAAWSTNVRSACGVLAAAVQQRLTTAARLREGILARPNIRWRGVLLGVLRDIEGGSQALSEVDFVNLCRRLGLPPPCRQVIRRDDRGRVRYLDAVWRLPDGRVVVVEVDGALHLQARNYWDDMARTNALLLAGEIVLRFPSWAVRAEDPLVIDQLVRALAPQH